jgi:L-ectoine synthase
VIIRNRHTVVPVEWGNGQSYRLLLARDGMGFAVAHTIVTAGTESRLQYREHLEACYCISGRGAVRTADGARTHILEPGTIYALDQNDAHVLIADPGEDMHLISVFNPPIHGQERHTLTDDGFSHYESAEIAEAVQA